MSKRVTIYDVLNREENLKDTEERLKILERFIELLIVDKNTDEDLSKKIDSLILKADPNNKCGSKLWSPLTSMENTVNKAIKEINKEQERIDLLKRKTEIQIEL